MVYNIKATSHRFTLQFLPKSLTPPWNFYFFYRCHHGTPSRMPLIKQPHNALKPSEFNANVISNEQQDEIDHNSQTTHNPQVPITIILLILTTYICIGTVIFSLWENWSIVDGAYFCFVTLSTIGFGNNPFF